MTEQTQPTEDQFVAILLQKAETIYRNLPVYWQETFLVMDQIETIGFDHWMFPKTPKSLNTLAAFIQRLSKEGTVIVNFHKPGLQVPVVINCPHVPKDDMLFAKEYLSNEANSILFKDHITVLFRTSFPEDGQHNLVIEFKKL